MALGNPFSGPKKRSIVSLETITKAKCLMTVGIVVKRKVCNNEMTEEPQLYITDNFSFH